MILLSWGCTNYFMYVQFTDILMKTWKTCLDSCDLIRYDWDFVKKNLFLFMENFPLN